MTAPLLTWYFEASAFPHAEERFRLAIEAAGHRFLRWHDRLWSAASLPAHDGPVVFMGSLENADRLSRAPTWVPGAYCAIDALRCSRWYPHAAPWLLNDRWVLTTVRELVETRAVPGGLADSAGRVFVRPDSPLKPFSGRVCHLPTLDLRALDFGFYYEDPALPVIIAPCRTVLDEWRFVVASGRVVAGSGYVASNHTPAGAPPADAWALAEQIAAQLPPPDDAYTLDLCATPDGLRLLELNPFSGADPYHCDAAAITAAIATSARRRFATRAASCAITEPTAIDAD